MQVTNVRWFSGATCVGIVKCLDSNGNTKYYIGSAANINEIWDVDQIMKWGANFPNNVGDVLFEL